MYTNKNTICNKNVILKVHSLSNPLVNSHYKERPMSNVAHIRNISHQKQS